MRINANMSAIIANNNLGRSENNLSAAIERLSSGKRINNASDDAAGLAISKKLSRQLKGLDQNDRNSNDGISVVQTAEGALGEIESILQRARELAVQAADATYSDEDREAIQAEVTQLMEEVDRISTDTEYNTMPLLDGTIQRRSYSDVDGVEVQSMSSSVQTGEYTFTIDTAATRAKYDMSSISYNVGDIIEINGAVVTATTASSDSYTDFVEACNKANLDIDGTTIYQKEYGTNMTIELSIKSSDGTEKTNVTTAGTDAVISNLDGRFSSSTVWRAEGEKIYLTGTNSFKMVVSTNNGYYDPAATGDVSLKVTDLGMMDIQVGTEEGQTISIDIPRIDTDTLGIDNVNLRTATGASRGIAQLDEAIKMVSSARSTLGAYQNRLETTLSNIGEYEYDLTSALSGIEDCDMAEEMTEYSTQNVITQAATSVMSQANARPDTVLQLLR